MQAVKAFVAWHRRLTMEAPYTTNAAQSAILMGAGDSCAQFLERKADASLSFSPSRLLTNVSWAAGLSAPFWTWWYFFLDRRWARGRVVGWVLASAALSPAFNGAFFCYNGAVLHALNDPRGVTSAEGRSALRAQLGDKLETQLLPTVVRSCTLWVPFNLMNFAFCPLEYRMLSGGIVALGWNVFLSLEAEKNSRQPAAAAP
jgi:hypothetical protein